MSPSDKLQFEFNLGKAGIKKFNSIEEAKQWCEIERSHWNWLQESNFQRQNTEIIQEINSAINRFLTQILHTLNNAANSNVTDLNQLRNYSNNINSHIKQYFRSNGFIFSDTPEAKFIESLQQDNQKLAAYTAGAFLGINLKPNIRESIEGYFLYHSFSYGIKDRMKNEIASFQKHHDDFNNLLANSKTRFEEASDEYSHLQEQQAIFLNEQKKIFEDFNKKSESDFQSLLEKSENELKNIERTYDEKLALQASVRYWKIKANSHAKTRQTITRILIIVALIVTGLLCLETWLVIGPAQTVSEIQIWKLGMLFLTAIVGIWMIRILVRILLSNIHLRSDAIERRTMLLTYLALLRGGQGPNEQQRELILQILFRPSSTGIIKDDALPPAVAQWLNLVTSN